MTVLKWMKTSKPNPLEKAALRQVVIDLLSRRDYSRQELIRKLQPKAASYDDLINVLDDMAARQWQSDERFTEMFIHARSQRYGPVRLAQELRQKGISETATREALAAADTNWRDTALDLLRRRFSADDLSDIKQKAKAYRFLAQRGYSAEQVQYALRQLTSLDEDLF